MREFLLGCIALIALLIDCRISLGILLGFLFSFLQEKLVELKVDVILQRRKAGALVFLSAFLSVAMMGIPLLISFLLPDVFSWIGVFIGMIYRKVYLFVANLIGGRK